MPSPPGSFNALPGSNPDQGGSNHSIPGGSHHSIPGGSNHSMPSYFSIPGSNPSSQPGSSHTLGGGSQAPPPPLPSHPPNAGSNTGIPNPVPPASSLPNPAQVSQVLLKS